MNPSTLNRVIVPGEADESQASRIRSIVRKSALLNVVIVLTSFPVLVYAGGPEAIVLTVEVMAGISVLIWTVTFVLLSLVTFPQIFRIKESLVTRNDAQNPSNEMGIADRWTDGPA